MSHPASTSRFARFALPVAAAGLLGGLAWLLAAGAAAEVAPVAVAAAPQLAASAGAGPIAGEPTERDSIAAALGCLGAPAGSMFRYRLTDRGDYQIQSAEAGAQPAGNLHLECFVSTTVLARSSVEVLVQHQFDGLQFLGGDGRAIVDDPVQASFVAAVAAPVLARLDLHGKVLGYGFADGLDGDQRNFLRGTLAVLTFQAPEAGAATWTCDEADTTGEYTARYEVLAAAGAHEVAVRRTRLHYTAITTQKELPVHELRGAGEATFSQQLGWLLTAKLDEGMTMALPLLDLRAITSRRAEVVLVSSDHVAVEPDQAKAWQRATAPASGRFEAVGQFAVTTEARRWAQQLQGVTLDQLLAELAELLAKQPVDPQAADALFQKMQWLVKLDGRVAAAIGERLAMRELAGESAGMAVSSLGAAGTPEAQAVLVAVRADRSLDAGLREHATIATLQLAEPSADLVEGLARDAGTDFEGRSSAMLVLGALSSRNQKPLGSGRTPIQELLAMEADAAARGDLSTWLLAVGNAAPVETLAIARRYLGHADAAVRGSACVALRRVSDPAVVTLLVDLGLADAEATVRREALLVLGRRPEPAARAAIERIAQGDANEELRNKANDLLRAGV